MNEVSGIVRMNLAAMSDEELIRLRGVMLLGLDVSTDQGLIDKGLVTQGLIDKGLATLAAIDEEFLSRGREP